MTRPLRSHYTFAVRRALPLLLLSSLGCASQPEPVPTLDEMRAQMKDPKGLLAIFQRLVRTEQYAVLWKHCLAVDPTTGRKFLEQEPFQLAMTNQEVRPVLPQLISSLEAHSVDEKAGTVRICSPEYGISRDFRVRLLAKRFWQFLFTMEDIDYFRERALAWFRKQVEVADGRHFAYPPDWKYARVVARCECRN